MPTFRAKYTLAEKKAFGLLVRRLMMDRGWGGAELARQVTQRLPKSEKAKTVDRSNISWWLNGRSTPTPVYLNALAAALDVDPALLLPRSGTQRIGDPPEPPEQDAKDLRMALLPGGKMHLMVNVRLPAPLGWEILQQIQEAIGETVAPKK